MHRSPAAILGIAVLVAAVIIGFVLLSASLQPPVGPPSSEASASAALQTELLNRRWTVLYVGTDLNARREGEGMAPNTDALMLVSLSADQSRLTLVSLPRDTVDLPLADGTPYARKINALYVEQGIDALVGAMERLFGVPIDGQIVLDMDDFATLVGAAGGVAVDPAEPLRDPKVSLDLPAGPQTLDASQALGYVRTRVDQDYGRMARQQEVLMALVGRLVDPQGSVDLGSLLDGLDSLDTDLPLDQLPTLVELARRATDAEVTGLVIQPPLITFEGDRGDGRGYVLEADVDSIRSEVQTLVGEDS